MVSLELQTSFFQSLSDSPLKPLLSEISLDRSGEYALDVSNATNLALNLIIAVKANDREKAEEFYMIFKKRQPTRESHWIYDNYALFCIVTAVSKFGFDQSWISEVINLSILGANTTNKVIRDTLKNLLAGNYNARNDFHQISIVYQFLSKDEHYDEAHINKMYNDLWIKEFPFYEDNFLNVISLKAIQVAFEKKSFLTQRNYYLLNQFIPSFERSVRNLASAITWILLISLIVGTFFGLWKINQLEDKFPAYVKTIFWIIGVSGVGVLGITGWRSQISEFLRKRINAFFHFEENDKNS